MDIKRERRFLRVRATVLRDELAIHYRVAGFRGALFVCTHLLSGHPKQISAKFKKFNHPFFLRLGTSDAEIYRDVVIGREYDQPLTFSPRTIVDVGANCGMTSLFYANRYPRAYIVAVEAEASNYTALVKNTRAYPNIRAIHAALWHREGQVEVFPPWPRWKGWGKWGFRVREGNGCRAITLPTLMREVGIDQIDILKVDVEGAEREIFSNCDWIDKVRLLAIELHDRDTPGCSEAVNAVTSGFEKIERGPVTFYARRQSRPATRAG